MVSSSFWSGRSRHATKKTRSQSTSKATSRPKERDGDGDEEVVKKPDADEMRRRRVAYYTATPLERRRISTAGGPQAKSKTTNSSRARSVSGSEQRHRRRKRKSSSSSESRSSKTSKESNDGQQKTEDYVYGARPAVTLEPIVEEAASDDYEARRSERRRPKRHSSPRRRSTVPLIDDEVTPDDSISQVGSRSTADRRRDSAQTRPSLKRSSTTSTRLQQVVEEPVSRRSATWPKTSRKPEPSLLGSMFRRHSTTSIPQTPRLVECLTCGSDDVPSTKSAKLACGHRMCHECLQRIFELSVKDPAHMPPKCCTDQHIPLAHVDKLFDTKFKLTWNRKYQEYHTKNRLYCPTPKCGYWIKPTHIHSSQGRKFATCPRCKTKVCALCNNKMHSSSDCPQDPEIAKIVEQAKTEGWQRCYSCNAMVERREGCNHMTCRCTAEFCIVCGLKWKSCDCPWFNYSNLPNPDHLNDMRIPEPIQVIYRQVFRAAADAIPMPPPPAPARAAAAQRNRTGPPPEVTYQQELDERRRQERLDADLARRLQLASLMDPDGEPRPRRRDGEEEVWGLGNAARHFLNDDFVQNAANVVMNAFGDANLGRRGDRASGRRRRPRPAEQNEGEPGLAGNFLGDESVINFGPARRAERVGR